MADRLQQLLKLYEADPEDPFCSYGIALEHAKAGRVDDALAWLETTLRVDPNYAYAHYQRARILSESGRIEEARQAVRDGLAAADRAGDGHAADELNTLAASLE